MSDLLLLQPVVIDNGSGTIRAGLAGEDSPKCVIPSYVGRTKHTRAMAGGIEGDTFVGKRVQELSGLLKIRYPLEHGIVTNWDDMELIWRHVYSEELGLDISQHPALLTEAPLNPRSNRDAAAEIMFETFNMPALYMSIQAVLSLYASGRTTGVVLDAGDGVSHAVPVYGGFSINNSIRRVDIAGRDVTEHLQTLLRKSGHVFQTSAEKEIVRKIKEETSFVALNPKEAEAEWELLTRHPERNNTIKKEYTLPDGHKIELGADRFRASEILFNPEIIGSEYPGLHTMVADSIARTDIELRRNLYGNIIMSGGATMTRGFGERLLHELQRSQPPHTRIKIMAPPERKYTTWVGGSILAGLSTFKKMWVTFEEYQEDNDMIHKKLA